MRQPDTTRFNDENLDRVAEQVAQLATTLTPIELDQVFTRARRLIRSAQRKVQERDDVQEANKDESRFNRMMDE